MEFVLEVVNNLIYFICVIEVGELFLAYKRKNVKYLREILVTISLITAAVMLYSSDMWIIAIAHIVSIVIVERVCFQETWKHILGLYIGSTMVLSMLSLLFSIISTEMMLFFSVEHSENTSRVVNLLIIFACLHVIGKYYKERYNDGLKNIGLKYWLLFITIMFFDAAVVVVFGDFILNSLEASRKYVIIFSYWCVVIGLLIQLVLLINTLVTRNVHKENEKLAKQFLESQNEHYQYLEKREHETKKFRHDIKNHLLLLENLLNTGKYEEAEAYLNTINEKVSSFNNQISVNNGIADAILNRFYTEAKEKGIALKVSGHFPLECHITAYDICTIFSNLLSNAIRAEVESEGNEILVIIKYTDDKLLLTVENDYAHELNEVDGVFKTTKEDALGHGYGLSNVTECVEKNGGNISISTDNHRFKARIIMLNAKEEML